MIARMQTGADLEPPVPRAGENLSRAQAWRAQWVDRRDSFGSIDRVVDPAR